MLVFIQKGGPVMYPLLLCSLVALTFIIERSLFWIRQNRGRSQQVVNRILELAEKQCYGQIDTLQEGSKDYVARMLYCGILHRQFSLKDALAMAAGEELKRMQRHLVILDTIITLAPLLGILGTVLGIIQSFDLLGSAGIEHPRAVTAGIAQALVTTAAGLAIAIFTLIPYNYFQSRVEEASRLLEKYGTSLEIVWNKQNYGLHRNPDGDPPGRSS
ncbi:MAG: MotA/TolQ/ExbB proton channel family protein [Syntrophobacteria bacterium]